jgi:hypothetical protein
MDIIRTFLRINCMLFLIAGALLTGCSDDEKITDPTVPQESWIYKPLGEGISGTVSVISSYNGKLYVGGNFGTAGGEAANYIAAWDGTQWSALGVGTSWPVYAFAEYDSKLIVGGSFGSAGGIQVNRIAAWDGSSWSALDTGIPGNVVIRDMCVLRDTLFVTGTEDPYSDSKRFIAAWNGSTWSMLESGVAGTGDMVCTYPGGLLVGGYVNTGVEWYPFVKTISGGEWYDWDHSSLPGSLHDLAFYDGYTYMGGSGSFPVKYFSASWHNVDTAYFGRTGGSTPQVRALCEFGGELIAGGQFESIGGTTVNNLAAWNGTAWSPLGSGVTVSPYGVEALAVWQDKLYVGGAITEAGGVPVSNIVEVTFE